MKIWFSYSRILLMMLLLCSCSNGSKQVQTVYVPVKEPRSYRYYPHYNYYRNGGNNLYYAPRRPYHYDNDYYYRNYYYHGVSRDNYYPNSYGSESLESEESEIKILPKLSLLLLLSAIGLAFSL